ncbi:Nitronate monooxygenase, partial [Pseudocercospora fuligena]
MLALAQPCLGTLILHTSDLAQLTILSSHAGNPDLRSQFKVQSFTILLLPLSAYWTTMGLKDTLPWTMSPLIINAPMGGIATADLAIAVTKAGGLGQIGGVPDYEDLLKQLAQAESALDRTSNGLLPIGVGILSFLMKQEDTLPILEKYRPAVVWLFASHNTSDYSEWAKSIRERLPSSQLWIQIGSVEGAVRIAKEAKPDVLCLQGIDAGGHGFEKGAGIVSLVPETIDALKAEGLDKKVSIVAAGGIADGRAVAAALTLGAEGVVMGTRFLSAPETKVHPQYREAIIHAKDGGQSTVRDKVFDELRGPNQWPGDYDGRSIRTASYRDKAEGVHIDEIRQRHADVARSESAGYAANGASGRAATWAGTGVGLVTKEQRAADIVEEVRQQALASLEAVKARFKILPADDQTLHSLMS